MTEMNEAGRKAAFDESMDAMADAYIRQWRADMHNRAYSAPLTKARKAHACCLCDGHIAPGQHYVRFADKNSGYWESNPVCHQCARGQPEEPQPAKRRAKARAGPAARQ